MRVARKAAGLLCAVLVWLSAKVHGGAAPMQQPDLPAVNRDDLLLQGGRLCPPALQPPSAGTTALSPAAYRRQHPLLDVPAVLQYNTHRISRRLCIVFHCAVHLGIAAGLCILKL